MSARQVEAISRFWKTVDKDGPAAVFAPHLGPCWLWRGSASNGYGQAHVPGLGTSAHRIAYLLTVGAIPPRLQLDHLCRVPACVNPEHLELVTAPENVARGKRGRLKDRADVPAQHPAGYLPSRFYSKGDERRERIVEYITEFTTRNGFCPTVRQIGSACGLSGPSATHYHLRILRALGRLEWEPDWSRSLRVARPHLVEQGVA